MVRGRRDFLASASFVATVLASGCSGTPSGSTGTDSPSVTATSPGRTETETTRTESPPLPDVREDVQEAEDIYLSWSGQQYHGYFGVTVGSIPRDFEELDRLLEDARRKYRQHWFDNSEESVRARLRWARTLHDWARIQFHAIHAYWALRAVRIGIFTQDYAGAEEGAGNFDDEVSAASDFLQAHREWWESEWSTRIAEITPAVHDAKLQQLELALHSMSFLKRSMVANVPTVRTFVDLLSKYVEGPTSVEQATFEDLIADLSEIETDLREFCCGTDEVEYHVETYREAITAAKNGVTELQKAASAARDGDVDGRRTYETQAKDAFEQSELLVHEDGEVARLVGQLGR